MSVFGHNKDNFSSVDMTECFHDVARQVNEIRKLMPEALSTSSHTILTRFNDSAELDKRITVLEGIVSTVKHSVQYKSFLDESRMLLIQMLANDSDVIREIRENDTLAAENNLQLLEVVQNYHVLASQEVIERQFPWSDIVMQPSKIGFFYEPAARDPRTGSIYQTRACSVSNMLTGERVIEFNNSTDVNYYSMVELMSVLHHETVHDQGAQLGHLLLTGQGDKVGELYHDALIWACIEKYQAVVPSEITKAYNAQCTEIVAYDQQYKFEHDMNQIIYREADNVTRLVCR